MSNYKVTDKDTKAPHIIPNVSSIDNRISNIIEYVQKLPEREQWKAIFRLEDILKEEFKADSKLLTSRDMTDKVLLDISGYMNYSICDLLGFDRVPCPTSTARLDSCYSGDEAARQTLYNVMNTSTAEEMIVRYKVGIARAVLINLAYLGWTEERIIAKCTDIDRCKLDMLYQTLAISRELERGGKAAYNAICFDRHLINYKQLIKLGWCGLNYNELCVIGKATGLTIEEILVGKIS